MDPEEKTALLNAFHPDFRPEGMRAVRVGPNKGDRVPNELAEQLEAESRIDPDSFDLSVIDYDVDVLVIGGGGGGSTAALVAQEQGASVLLATKLRHGDSNTTMAEGGIAAASHPHDNPYLHYLDTLGGGRYMNKPALVQALVMEAPLILDWLLTLGVMFDRDADGTLICSLAGGQSRKRIHSAKDHSGLEMMRVLRDECQNRQIPVVEFAPVVELLLDEQGRCAGAILCNLDTGRHLAVRAKAVILATGGIGRLHILGSPTTNHYGATADGLVIAYRAGARLLYMDAIQYHPTGAAWPEQMLGWLCTEALRGTGAHLVNQDHLQRSGPESHAAGLGRHLRDPGVSLLRQLRGRLPGRGEQARRHDVRPDLHAAGTRGGGGMPALLLFLLDRHHFTLALRRSLSWSAGDRIWFRDTWAWLKSCGKKGTLKRGAYNPGQRLWYLYAPAAVTVFAVTGGIKFVGPEVLGKGPVTGATYVHVMLAVATDVLLLLHVYLKRVWPTLREVVRGTRLFFEYQRRRKMVVPMQVR